MSILPIIAPPARSQVLQIPQAAGTVFGDFNGAGALVRQFDGVDPESIATASGKANTTNAYIGKSWAYPKIFAMAQARGTSDHGFEGSTNSTITITAYGRQGAAPVNGTDGTVLGSTTFTDANNYLATINSNNLNTYWDHFWLRFTKASASQWMWCAETYFYELG